METPARRGEITDLAIGLIAEHGYAKTSLARIAAAAGVTNGAVLYHFGSKNAVLQSAYEKVIGEVVATVGAAVAAAPSARDAIDAYVRSLVGYMMANPTHVRLLVEVLMTKGSAPEVASSPAPRWAALAALMASAQRDGDLRPFDTRNAAIALGGAIDAIFAESLADPQYDLPAAIEDLIELFRAGTAAHSA